MSFTRLIAAACAFWVMVLGAHASPNREAADAYQRGAFERAARLATAAGGAADMTLAARALIAEAVTTRNQSEVDDLLDRAIASADTALSKDRASVEARLQLALAMGMKGRGMSVTQALRAGYARKGRRLIDEALALSPNEAWAHALLGGWHLEVLRRGGRAGAAFYGARLETGLAAFERARRLAPEDGVIAFHYAVALLEAGGERRADQADALLAATQASAPRNAFEAAVQAEAGQIRALLKEKGAAAAAHAATGRFSARH